MSKSVERVRQAAHAAGFDIEIREMPDSTHTAEDAAVQCGVTVGQIVKSLIFQGAETAKLYLFLVSGPRQLDLGKAARLTGVDFDRKTVNTVDDKKPAPVVEAEAPAEEA